MRKMQNVLAIVFVAVFLTGCQTQIQRTTTTTRITTSTTRSRITTTTNRSTTSSTVTTSTVTTTSSIPTTTISAFDDGDLNRGSAVRLVGTNVDNAPASYISAASNPTKQLWYLTTNPWAIENAEGNVTAEYTGTGRINFNVNMRNINGTFGGYPSVIYGRSPWSGILTSDQPAQLPRQVRQMNSLSCLTDYALTMNQAGGNIAYDLWLTDAQLPGNPYGGVEIMIWYWQNNTSPLGTYTQDSVKPITINDLSVSSNFKVYIKRQSTPTEWDVVSFVLDDSQMVQSGKVEIDILDFIRTALPLVSRSEDLYLQDIEFGMEFTNQDQDFNLELNKFGINQRL